MQRSILIIEDDVDIRESLKEFLEAEGHQVRAVGNGELGLKVLEGAPSDAPIDLILLDLMMPVMNGVEFRKKQLQHPSHARIPVVVISADNRTQGIAETLGLRWCIQKPMDLDELLTAVERAGRDSAAAPAEVAPLRTGSPPAAREERSTWKA